MMSLDSPSLTAKGLSLSRLHAELIKKGKPLSLTNTSFEVYGGKVHTSGELFPGPQTQADLQIKLSSLSLAAMSGKKDLPARLSGDLKVKSKDLENLDSYHGGGVVTVGPVPLPAVDLKSKIKIAEVLSAGTELGNMVNVGMLGNSAHVIGTQIDTIKATVGIGGGNITLQPFSMGNGHFSASGNGTIIRQKNVSGSGIFTLNQRVTRQLILDPLLRRTLTDGRDQLSFPFSFQGPLSDPNVTVDSSALRGKMARAMVLVLQKQALGQLDAQKILDSSLKGTPLGDPKNPLGRILGTTTHSGKTAPQTTSRTPPSQKSPAQTKKPQSTTGNPLADQLLFGR
jgi:hypothetical protein